LQNLLSHNSAGNIFRISGLLLALLIISVPKADSSVVIRKTKVTFWSADSIEITADHYYSKKTNPYIILLHQEQSSRGEYDSIAERFVMMNYNCLAVDLRSGDKYGYVENETAKKAIEEGVPVDFIESLKDIDAAVEFVKTLSDQEIVLLGSGYSASLALLYASDHDIIRAVIAFSPGEYFKPEIDVQSIVADLKMPVYIACSDPEFPYIEDMFSELDSNRKIIFKPTFGPGVRGSAALLKNNPTRDEYWLSLLLFFKSIS